MITEDAESGLIPWVVVATAGSTNLGKVDPLREISNLAKAHGLWFHVDGAYGGFFALTKTAKTLFDGISEADSIVLDPHKGMFLPYGSGAVLVRDGELMRYQATGSYLQDRGGHATRSPMDYSIELSRPFRALRIWLALKVHGEKAFIAALEEKLLLAKLVYKELLAIPGVEVFGPPDLSVVAFRMTGENRRSEQLLARILKQGRAFLSSTTINQKFYIRIAVLSVRTHLPLVDELLETIKYEVSSLS
jgi:glutamate/tyrosine decarboxylase-like PLP-dependent enzyme